ncbi:sensor histidine kinase [Brachybacterium ginsengisoli]|uniref:Oxygen sensor histidine kinase NreB n=1 Tax=Brachybacterium ginsengisoli TaxID=1331682 RepID=A0A291H1I2_9MICO|nr:ATP-binding protein [Brachybacterium ginsengisoli]ATG56338.1 sensor histidine kinase [Brachybacterium ginsengisoli]
MSSDPAAVDPRDSAAPATLATILRGAMHLAFAVLLSLGALRAHTVEQVPLPLALGLAALVAAIYGTGTALARRRRDPAAVGTTDLLLPSRGWVIALLAAWVAATLISSAFVWLAFPLFFLVLFSLGALAGPLVLLAVALWAVLAPLAVGAQDTLGIGEVLGPLVGAVFSLVAHTVWRRLLEESERNRRLVARLRATQADLAAAERRKGVAEERQRLAQDLHDTLAQGLNSIVLMSRSAAAAHPEAQGDFSRIEDTARANLADARGLVRDLASRAPQDGLEEVLRIVVERADGLGAPTRFELRTDGEAQRPAPELVETMQRAAQSLLANVVQHAEAERCVLTLAWWPDRVTLDVVDDGTGFDPAAVRPGRSGGDGLALLRSRIARAGGTVAIDSRPGEGTTVALTLPLVTGEDAARNPLTSEDA